MIKSETEFKNASSILCGRLISSNSDTRAQAILEARNLINELPKMIVNSPACRSEIEAIKQLIA